MAKQVYVWDKFVRVFHWSLVALFITSYISGEQEYGIHVYSGYGIFILICLRVFWGFVGSAHAKFSDFIYSPETVLSYLKTIVTGHPKRYLGHNPAGGLMIIALLATLFATTLSGMKLYAIEEGKGPFAQQLSVAIIASAHASPDDDVLHNSSVHDEDEDEEAEEFWEDVHETAVSLMLLLIALHIGGVIIASKQHQEALISAMFSGFKREPSPPSK